jgi:hypothetical protein
MGKKSIPVLTIAVILICFSTLLIGADVHWHSGQTPPSATWIISPAAPHTEDIVYFCGPADGDWHPNSCQADGAFDGYPVLTINNNNKTIELWFQGPGPEICPLLYDPVCGLEGNFDLLAEGDWLFYCNHPFAHFSIPFHVSSANQLTLTYPNGSEKLAFGTTKTISWNSTGSIDNIYIKYSNDNGANWNIIDANTPNDGQYEWFVPEVDSNQCLVSISDANDFAVYDISDDVFTIFQCTASIASDLNNDCVIDFADYAIFADHWLQSNIQLYYPAPNQNLLVNSGFEQPGPLPGEPNSTPYYGSASSNPNQYIGAKRWFRWAGGGCPITDVNYIVNDATNAHTGSDYIRLKHTNGTGWIGFTQIVINDNDVNDIHPVSSIYTQSIYARDPNNTAARFRFKLSFYKDWDFYCYCYPLITWYLSPIYTLTTDWRRYDYVFAIPAGTQKLYVSYYVGDSITNLETIYLDDANLIEGQRFLACGHDIGAPGWTALPGDLNEDCYVNITDLGLWVEDWLRDCTTEPCP